ncbi:TniQ family protein [Nocardia terpenica]|uniref:TniQ domain-containing protein n=1 Tax=Nocardia terpenica TaxID=455432 RepID=A0A6G9ZDE9_9NOCA|nr:TniQ family protein [Nocardia terpenica]QIS23532.1 hypothetical protein F6W96_39840 [Nocardia terpenica]QIS23537.1 hypothetical protein F6W96_39900 [Nocardia terpenica]
MATTQTAARRTCADCRKKLPVTERPTRRRYCDNTCRSRAWHRKKRREQLTERAGSPNRRCPVCGQEIFESLQTRTDQTYCSGRCRNRAYRARRTTETLTGVERLMRSLPVPLRPFEHETLASYLHRLAAANHISETVLRHHLRVHLGSASSFNVDRLAAAVGTPAPLLRYALPELRSSTEETVMATAGRAVDLARTNIRPACRRCAAARGILEPLPRWHQPHHYVCLRHQLWIGPGVTSPDQQFDIAAVPEIGRAQRRLLRLARHHNAEDFRTAHTEATRICRLWSTNSQYGTQRNRRLRALGHPRPPTSSPPLLAAAHPEVVALTGMFLEPRWRHLAATQDPRDLDQLCAEISRRIGQPYQPSSNRDPMTRWIREQDPPPISPHAIDW